jgi:hypothetical protein
MPLTDKGLRQIRKVVGRLYQCQGGGAATQMPAEHYHSGSNPDLGFPVVGYMASFFGISSVACFIPLNHGHHCQRTADEILL